MMAIGLGRRVGRLILFAWMCVTLGWAAGPQTTVVQEALFGGKSGADKKNAAISFIGSAISLTDAIANKQVIDPEKFQGGLSKIVDGVVDCLNASAWAK